jgi:hypothetical protein
MIVSVANIIVIVFSFYCKINKFYYWKSAIYKLQLQLFIIKPEKLTLFAIKNL